MRKYNELPENPVNHEEVEQLIEYIFKEKIISQNDVGKQFTIAQDEYFALTEDFNFTKEYCLNFGYKVELFYEFYGKSFNPRYYIKFSV